MFELILDRDAAKAVASFIYLTIAAAFFAETFLEGERGRAAWNAWRVAGLLSSAIWPIVVLVLMLIYLVRDGRKRGLG